MLQLWMKKATSTDKLLIEFLLLKETTNIQVFISQKWEIIVQAHNKNHKAIVIRTPYLLYPTFQMKISKHFTKMGIIPISQMKEHKL